MNQEKPVVTIGIIGEKPTADMRLSVAIHNFAIRTGLIDTSYPAAPKNVSLPGQEEIHLFDFESDCRRYHVIDDRIVEGIATNMVSDTTPLDGAILVINLADPVDRALSYIGLARQFLIPALIVVLNDPGGKFNPEELSAVQQLVTEELEKHFYPIDATPIMTLDAEAYSANGMDSELTQELSELVQTLDKIIPQPEQSSDAPLLLRIEQSFSIAGRGTIVRGMHVGRWVLPGDKVLIAGTGEGTTERTVLNIDEGDIPASFRNPDSILLDYSDSNNLIGKRVAMPEAIEKIDNFSTQISWLTREEEGWAAPIEKVSFHFGDRAVQGRIVLQDNGVPSIGNVSEVMVNLDESVYAEPTARYTIRAGGRTIGTGVVAGNLPHVASLEEQARDVADAPVVRAIDFEIGRLSDQHVGFYFATTRAPSTNETHLEYSGERSDDLRLGRALVRIPDQRVPGSLELPRKGWKISLLGKQIRLFRQKVNPRKHFLIKDIEEMDQAAWLADINSQKTKQALVFVHGFNNSFEDSVYRAAQIFWDLRFTGLPVLFSWASRGGVCSYIYDQQSALNARENFLRMLDMLTDQGVEEVFILAHSMGNLLVTEALSQAHEAQIRFIHELVMAAADVDKDNFRQFCHKMVNLHGKMTLYASAADRALLASMKLADNIFRAGFVPEEGPIVLPGLDTIDGTPLGDEMFGLNHGDYAEEATFLNDMNILISQRIRPPTRRLVSYQERSRIEDNKTLRWWLYPVR